MDNISLKKQKYIDQAISVFKQEGLRLSLDEIADKMGIVKKTLYNHFESKDDLLRECIQSSINELRNKIEVMNDDRFNAVEGMRKGFEEMSKFFYALSPVFFHDIKKLYPEMAMAEHHATIGLFSDKIVGNLNKGIKEQIYRQDMDVALMSQYFIYSVFGFFINRVINSSEFSAKNYFPTVLEYNLRALVSEKGLKYL
ncbi:MAG: TetR/AcrR family transcriptional regulator [Bacteroidales bacterium]|nr:TetR/AcrR family transcriptional regulator [Bacteroidales bacterium]